MNSYNCRRWFYIPQGIRRVAYRVSPCSLSGVAVSLSTYRTLCETFVKLGVTNPFCAIAYWKTNASFTEKQETWRICSLLRKNGTQDSQENNVRQQAPSPQNESGVFVSCVAETPAPTRRGTVHYLGNLQRGSPRRFCHFTEFTQNALGQRLINT